MNKFQKLCCTVMLSAALLTGCASQSKTIGVVSREEGSGTRGAFTELFKLEEDGKDLTLQTAETTNSTAVMMTTIAGNEAGIGYVSLGSLDESKVKAVSVDGVKPSSENVKAGSYKVSRPFNIVTKEGVDNALAQDFISFILSNQGQKVVADNGLVSMDTTTDYQASNLEGKLVVGGSSSVTPVMEKIKEAYVALNPNVTIDVQQTDSTSGAKGCAEGLLDIGMISREIKDSEKSQGLKDQAIALDGIAVIVNLNNEVSDLTSEQIQKIYKGEVTTWDEL